MLKKIAVTLIFANLLTSASVLAQWNGQVVLTPLEQVVAQAKDDQWVKTRGYLVERLSDDTYLLKMGDSELKVEIDQYDFPKEPFSPSDLIEVEGEIDSDWFSGVELDVEKITLVVPQ